MFILASKVLLKKATKILDLLTTMLDFPWLDSPIDDVTSSVSQCSNLLEFQK